MELQKVSDRPKLPPDQRIRDGERFTAEEMRDMLGCDPMDANNNIVMLTWRTRLERRFQELNEDRTPVIEQDHGAVSILYGEAAVDNVHRRGCRAKRILGKAVRQSVSIDRSRIPDDETRRKLETNQLKMAREYAALEREKRRRIADEEIEAEMRKPTPKLPPKSLPKPRTQEND